MPIAGSFSLTRTTASRGTLPRRYRFEGCSQFCKRSSQVSRRSRESMEPTMKLLPWLMIIALCLAAVAVETADQESVNDMLLARYHRNQLSRGRRDDSSGDEAYKAELAKMMQDLTDEIRELLPTVKHSTFKIEKCGVLPPTVLEMVGILGTYLKIARSAGYIN